MSTMSVTFTKLFASITESTVWMQPDHTRLVWITMLAMADRRGRVFASIPGLAHRARIDVDLTQSAIKTFLEPDEYSRSPESEGRRILAIDGGWRLVNHDKYRALRDEEAIKESKRKYINTRRAKEVGPIRDYIKRRDGSRCGICARDMDASVAEIDHIIPKILGGPDDLNNYQFSHSACNKKKSACQTGHPPRHSSMPSLHGLHVDKVEKVDTMQRQRQRQRQRADSEVKKRVLRNTPKENDPGVNDPLCATVDWVMFRWNEIEGVKHINEDPPLETKKRIAARISEHPKKAWWDDKFFSRVGASEYLCGKSNVEWKATLDWACGPKNMTKILNDLYLTTQRKADGAGVLLGEESQ